MAFGFGANIPAMLIKLPFGAAIVEMLGLAVNSNLDELAVNANGDTLGVQ